MTWRRLCAVVGMLTSLTLASTVPATAHPALDGSNPPAPDGAVLRAARALPAAAAPADGKTTTARCVNGTAAGYACDDVDLLAHLSLDTIGGGTGNDVWGWTDAASRRRFVVMGRSNGTAFIEITTPRSPVYLGSLPGRGAASTWRDVKVIADHAVIVSESPSHGMQVFDLTRLLDVADPPQTFTESAHYDRFGSAHNVVVNEDAGAAYAVGSATCGGGLHIIRMTRPTAPAFAGCFSADGYTHDAQCVTYAGPDTDHQARHVCVASNEDTLTIVDVTDPANATLISRTTYANAGYAHQGWLSEDHATLFMDDELDELKLGGSTRTLVWDVSDLDAPRLAGTHTGSTPATDHNLYVAGHHVYQANYRAGLRILRLDPAAPTELEEVGFFDTYPSGDDPGFDGAWSVYPWFDRSVVAVSDMKRGLFLLRFRPRAVHVHDLRDVSRNRPDDRWRARVKIKVRDHTEAPVAGASVTGVFGTRKTRSCLTDETGRCTVSVRVRDGRRRIPFQVQTIVAADSRHEPDADHDAFGNDSNNGRIVARRPAR